MRRARRSTSHRRLVALALLLGALVLAQGASSYTSAGTPWPVTRLSVWNDTPYRTALTRAMASWNAVGTRIQLVPAERRSAARVVVALLPEGASSTHAGTGTVGWAPAQRGKVEIRAGLSDRAAAAVLTHELGHVLGLGHEEGGCSVMSATVNVERPRPGCPIARCARLEECLVQPDDAEGLRHQYGNRLQALRPLGVDGVTARVLRAGGAYLEVSWRSPEAGPGTAVLVRAESGRCPSSPYGTPLTRTGSVALLRGVVQSAALPVHRPGRWCTGVWVQEGVSFLVGPPTYVRSTVR
ncbi:MAG: M57 family metalloprotease [Gaiella sp.]